tara:strand:- start:199 stop:585 length:387 start_codon:yes stop_codon:yes gene_type:complete
MIKKLKQFFETQTSLLEKKAGIFKEEDIECSVDEQVVDCKELDKDPYVGVPAPILNPVDEWFASPYGCSPAITKKQQDYMEQETKMKKAEVQTKEPDNIHQLMYEIATKNSATTLQIDPIGGSENVHR